MLDEMKNNDEFKAIDAALRRDVGPEEPLSPELRSRIVTAIRAQSQTPQTVRPRRWFAVAALAAAVLLIATVIVMNREADPGAERIAKSKPSPTPVEVLNNISPAPVIAAASDFAADSVVQEMRHVAQDATDIGNAMLSVVPGDVNRTELLAGLLGR
jgi:hypothetical protein